MTIENEEGQEQETSMRDDMLSAMEEFEDNDDKSGGDGYVEETPKVEKEEKEITQGSDINGDDAGTGGEEKPTGKDEPVKAPGSWTPQLREEFSQLSPTLQAQINKRETEMNKFQNEGAESRKFGERMGQALQPYQALMQAHGTNDPIAAVNGLMDTANTLQMGTPQQKATKLAEMVQHYGVDISLLDGALVGNPQTNPQQSQLEQMLEQKLAPMNNFMNSVQQNQQYSQQQTQQNAATEVSQFEQSAEFINDVRNDMADLLDMAASRNQTMSLQQAYDKAIMLHPEISSVLDQRKKDDAIKGKGNLIRQKRQASSSLNGQRQGVDGKGNTDDSIASLLSDAWDDSLRG